MQRRLPEPAASRPVFAIRDGFVHHPYLKEKAVEARDFQVSVAEHALKENTLVVVPTGLGKTLIAVLVAAELLRQKRGTVLLLAPTRPLALQHFETMVRLLRDEGLIRLLSGAVSPSERAKLWSSGILVVATPQTIRNDLDKGRYDLAPLALVIFDEAHRAVGDYAYVQIGRRLRFENPKARVLALTASPGANRDRLADVRKNLGVVSYEVRDASSPDVAPYVQPVALDVRFVELTPTLRRVAKPFHELLEEKEEKLRNLGVVKGQRPYGLGRGELVTLVQTLARSRFWAGLHPAALAHQARLCLDLVEVYGVDAAKRYLDRFQAREDLSRNDKSFLNDSRTAEAMELLSKPFETSHPKITVLLQILAELRATKPDVLAIVFTQYRDSIPSLLDALRNAGYGAERFVGQAAREGEAGLSQKEQGLLLERFRKREFPVLVSTSIGEEGIDVPQVDVVVFYDAVPSEIRSIQRRGRTGRTVAGRVAVLVAKGTSDEGAYKASLRKEERMRRLVSRYT